MTLSRWVVFFASTLLAVVACFGSFTFGRHEALIRANYVSLIFLKISQKCFDANDAECFRANWRSNVEATSAVAKALLDSSIPSPVSRDLRTYVVWADQLPPYQRSQSAPNNDGASR